MSLVGRSDQEPCSTVDPAVRFRREAPPQRIAPSRQAVTGDQDLPSVPVRAQAIAVFIDEHHAPGKLVEGAQRSVSLELQFGHAAVHSQCALQMRQQQAKTFDIVMAECGLLPRSHRFEKHSNRMFPGKHSAKAMMQILRS